MITSAKDRVEQRIALGDTPVEIALRERLPLKTVERIVAAMERAHRDPETLPAVNGKRRSRGKYTTRRPCTSCGARTRMAGGVCADCVQGIDSAKRRHPAGKAL